MTAPWPSLFNCLTSELLPFFFLSLSPAFKLQALPGESTALTARRSQEQDSWQSDVAPIPRQEPGESPSLRETPARRVLSPHPITPSHCPVLQWVLLQPPWGSGGHQGGSVIQGRGPRVPVPSVWGGHPSLLGGMQDLQPRRAVRPWRCSPPQCCSSS